MSSALEPVKDLWLADAVNLLTYASTIPVVEVDGFTKIVNQLLENLSAEFIPEPLLRQRIVDAVLKVKGSTRAETITNLVATDLFNGIKRETTYSPKTEEDVKQKIVNLFRKQQVPLLKIFDNPDAMNWLCCVWEFKHPSPTTLK